MDVRTAPAGLSDLQRFSFTLTPHVGSCVRRIAVGKKRMPDAKIREREWAYVDRVGSAAHVIADLGPRTYMTKTRGLRQQPEAIEIACGQYAIASHRDHAHLLYEIDLQLEDGTRRLAQQDLLLRNLNIVSAASYIVAVFNPEATSRRRGRQQRRQRADKEEANVPFSEPSFYEEVLMERFGAKRRFAPLEPSFLDHEGTELVLIGGSAPRRITNA